jgi:superfamily II DNA or RNA helicase
VDLVKKYYLEGHSIVIPVWRKEQVANLVDLINKRAGKPIATAFTGIVKDKDRKSDIIDMRNRQLRVIVGIRSILSRGINIPTLSCLIVAAPISNPPNFKQETSRVLTPLAGKIQPVIHHLLDDAGGLALGCFRNCVLNTYVANKWHITKENWELITPFIRVTKRKLYDDDIGATPAVGAKRSTFAAFAARRKR